MKKLDNIIGFKYFENVLNTYDWEGSGGSVSNFYAYKKNNSVVIIGIFKDSSEIDCIKYIQVFKGSNKSKKIDLLKSSFIPFQLIEFIENYIQYELSPFLKDYI